MDEQQPPRAPSTVFSVTTNRPVAILMVVVAVCVFGWVSYQRLALNLMPDISYPTVTVRTEYPGSAPEEVETLLSRPLEEELSIVPRLVDITSISKAGQSDVILEFQWGTDMNTIVQDVREKVDRVWLPQDAKKPLLLRYDPSLDPILRVGLYGPQDLYRLRYLAEHEIKRRLEALEGVAAVKVKGGLEEEIHVALDEHRIALMGLDIGTIVNRLAENNVNLPGGNLREGQVEYLIRTLNEFRTVDAIRNLVVARTHGVDVHLRDIARVYRSHKDRQIITRVDGRESVEIEVYKEADANVVAVAHRVRAALFGLPRQRAYVAGLQQRKKTPHGASAVGGGKAPARGNKGRHRGGGGGRKGGGGGGLRAQKQRAAARTMEHLRLTDFIAYRLPEEARLEVLSDQSVFIQHSISEVKSSAVVGGVMAVVVLFVFLRNVVHTLTIGLTIPISIVATFAPMYMAHVSLNIMSLGGLALGVGMLVDNSIVVLESIFRCREEGDDLIRATLRGAGEVGGAVFASTMTTIAVFFPIVFVEGVAGQVFGDMALTVVFSLLASLAVALFFIPMLASRRLGGRDGDTGGGGSDFLHLHAVERARRSLHASGRPLWRRGGDVAGVLPYLFYELAWRVTLAAATCVAVALKTVAVGLFEFSWPVLRGVEWVAKRRSGKDGPSWQAQVCAWAERNRLSRRRAPAWLWIPLVAAAALWAGLMLTGRVPEVWVQALGMRIPGWTPARMLMILGIMGLAGLAFALQDFDRVWPGVTAVRAPGNLSAGVGALCSWVSGPRRWIWRVLRAGGVPLVLVYLMVRFLFQLVVGLVGAGVQIWGMVLGVAGIAAAFFVGLALTPLFLPLLFLFQRGFGALQGAYPTVLRAALRHRLAVIGLAAALFAVCWFDLAPRLGSELIPQVHQGQFDLDVSLPVGTPLETTARAVERIESVVRRQPEVERVASTIGTDKSATSSAEEGENTAHILVKMLPASTPAREDALIRRLRIQLRDLPQVHLEVSHPALFSFKTPVQVEVRGYDLDTLRTLSRRVQALLREVPGLVDVQSTLRAGNPELQIRYHRDRLAKLGLNLGKVAELVRTKVQGRVATHFREQERQVDVRVRLRSQDRLGLEELKRIVVNPGSPVPIRLAAVADFEVHEGPSEIRRVDQQRAAVITANIQGVDLGTASERIERVLQRIDFPEGFTYFIAGQNKEMETSMHSLYFALGLAIFLVYVVMASQFESLIHPLAIMVTVPLALIGVIVVLWAQHIPLSVVVFIGMIMLAGIVVNNAIVLVDYINTLRRGGMARARAIVRAGSVRLRPILMTTTTTVLGLLPMALGLGEGAEIRTPMAITVIAGLISSTLLTLIVIPVVYSVLDRGPAE